jgi:hypothetical protein
MLAFRKCRRSDNSEEQPAITARKQRKQCRTTIKRFLYRRRARAIRSPTPLRGSVCVLASSSDIAYDCGNSAVLPACREFSEHICSPNGRAEDALESALAMYVPPRSRCQHRPRRRQTRSLCPFRRWGWRKPRCTRQCANKASVVQSSPSATLAPPANQSRARPASRLADGTCGSRARRSRTASYRRCGSGGMRQAASGRIDD